LEIALSDILGVPVDVLTPRGIGERRIGQVLREALPL
jgi:predicted nucleotidyltransferase